MLRNLTIPSEYVVPGTNTLAPVSMKFEDQLKNVGRNFVQLLNLPFTSLSFIFTLYVYYLSGEKKIEL